MKKLELDVQLKSTEHEVDMQYGLETLKGTSDVVSLISEAILMGGIEKQGRRTHRSDSVRTKMKQSFKGSYGQKFALEIIDPDCKRRLKKIGDDVFLEVLSYFVMEALYLDSGELSEQASQVLDEFGDESENLIKRLENPLKGMHQISKYYDYDVKLHFRKRGNEPRELATLNKKTSINLTDARTSKDVYKIEAVIIRYHSKTGNGRLHIRGGSEFVSFGFASGISGAKLRLRKKISENLHLNNTVDDPEHGQFINLLVRRKALPTGEVVKYLVTGIEE